VAAPLLRVELVRPVRDLTAGQRVLVGVAVIVALTASGCSSGNSDSEDRGLDTGPGIDTAPRSQRVDLDQPSFSDPTAVTNPLFPSSKLGQVVQLGNEGGEELRVEITPLPRSKSIEWKRTRIETLVSHFIAFLDGRIVETAVDFFAQADDGAVWYLGEDVFNYEDGVVANNEGTWLAGKDGPGGMIMPADPHEGDVFRPENIPGLVFEEVTIKSTERTVDGPRGRIDGAVVTQEHLMDDTFEGKIFAPGYGEFQVRAEDEFAAVAIATPIDSASGPTPTELEEVIARAEDVFEAVQAEDWRKAADAQAELSGAWDAYRQQRVPPLLAMHLEERLVALDKGISSRDSSETSQAAIDVAQSGADLLLRHLSAAEVDLVRLDVWARQLLLDAADGSSGEVAGDVATLEAIWVRSGHSVSQPVSGDIEEALAALRAAADAGKLGEAVEAVTDFRQAVATATRL
jgi:hypothetical protein